MPFKSCGAQPASNSNSPEQRPYVSSSIFGDGVYFLYCRWISTRRLGMHGRRYRCQAADCQGYPRMTPVRVMVRLYNPGLEREKTIRHIEFLT